jgi:tetratricopeptide (TPR) repeat protein
MEVSAGAVAVTTDTDIPLFEHRPELHHYRMRRRWVLYGLVSITLLSVLTGLGFRFDWWGEFTNPDQGVWPWIEAASWVIGMTTGTLSALGARSGRPPTPAPVPAVTAPARDPSLLDRNLEYECLYESLRRDQPPGVVIVFGHAGVGKSKLVNAVLADLHKQGQRFTKYEHSASPGHRFDVRELIGDLEGMDRPAELEPGETRRNRLELALRDSALMQKVVVIENAEHLVVPGSQRNVDLQLDEALETIYRRWAAHRVTVVLVSRTLLDSPGQRMWAQEPPITIGRLPEPDFTSYLKTRIPGRDGVIDRRHQTLHDQLNGNPRCAQLMIAIVEFSEPELDMDVVLRQITGIDAQVMPRRLAEILVETMNERRRDVIQALAAFATPIDAATVAAVLGPSVTPATVTATLQRFSNRELVRSDGADYALTFEETDWFLPTEATQRSTLLRHVADQLKRRRMQDPQTLDDLPGHFAYLDVLLAARRYAVAYSAMVPMTTVLKRYNSHHLLLEQRKKIRGRIGQPGLEMLNDNELGGAYTLIGDLAAADVVYGPALEAAKRLGNPAVRATIRCNFGAFYWQSGRADRAYNYYLDALHDAQEHQPALLEAAVLGLAECHRRWGEYDRAFAYADRVLPTTRSVQLLLRVARWRVETGDTRTAGELIRRADKASGDSLWHRAACHEAQADLLLAEDDLPSARTEAATALEEAVQAHNSVVLLQARTTLCWVELISGYPDKAQRHIEEAAHYRTPGQALIVLALDALIKQATDPRAARRLFDTLATEAQERVKDEKDRIAHDMLGLAVCGQTFLPQPALTHFDTAATAAHVLRKRRNLLVQRLDKYARPPGVLRPVLEILTDTESRTLD